MAKFSTRRFIGDLFRLVGHSFEEIAQDLEEKLNKLAEQVVGGIPGGFNGTAPSALSLNAAPSAGVESDGWTPPSHVHQLDLLLSAKGDLLSFDGTLYVRVSQAGAPDGAALIKDSAQQSGIKWSTVSIIPSTPPSGPTSSELADLQLRAAFDSLPLRELIRRGFS